MATVTANAPKSICNSKLKYSVNSMNVAAAAAPPPKPTGPPLPQLYVDTITAAFGERADLYKDVLRISPDAMPIEQRIAYFKRGREIMKESGSTIRAPRDLPPPIRERLKAINMAYDIVSNPEWQNQYASRSSAPRVKSNVRFNDHIEEHVFEREPWEEDYIREKRERRMQRFQDCEEEEESQESFWNDFLMEMDSFELGLDGFLQAFPDRIARTDSCDDSTSSFPDTQSFSSWLSQSVQSEQTKSTKESEPEVDIETTSYMSSFDPFTDEVPRRSVRSPTSVPQELDETSRPSRAGKKKEKRSSNSFEDDAPKSSNPFDDENDSNDLDTTNPFEDGALDVTNLFEDDAMDGNNPFGGSSDDDSNPFSAASNARFGIDTFQVKQKHRRSRRATTGSNLDDTSQLTDAFDEASKALDAANKKQMQRSSFPSVGAKGRRKSKNPFDDEPNDVSGDQTSVFEGLEEIWEDEGVRVDGVSVISDLSESVVAKRAKEKKLEFNPFGTIEEGARGPSNNRNTSSMGDPTWGGSESEEVGLAAAASAIAACCASLVADCQKNTEAIANFEIEKGLKNLFAVEADPAAKPSPKQQDDPFDEMEKLFDDMEEPII